MSHAKFRDGDAQRAPRVISGIWNPTLFKFFAVAGEIKIGGRLDDERISIEKRVAPQRIRRRRSHVAPLQRLSQRVHLAFDRGTSDDVGHISTGSAENELAGNGALIRIWSRMESRASAAQREKAGMHRLLRP